MKIKAKYLMMLFVGILLFTIPSPGFANSSNSVSLEYLDVYYSDLDGDGEQDDVYIYFNLIATDSELFEEAYIYLQIVMTLPSGLQHNFQLFMYVDYEDYEDYHDYYYEEEDYYHDDGFYWHRYCSDTNCWDMRNQISYTVTQTGDGILLFNIETYNTATEPGWYDLDISGWVFGEHGRARIYHPTIIFDPPGGGNGDPGFK